MLKANLTKYYLIITNNFSLQIESMQKLKNKLKISKVIFNKNFKEHNSLYNKYEIHYCEAK